MWSMAVETGPLTLVYPKWIPGEHSPTGPISGRPDLLAKKKSASVPSPKNY
jgi:hypothetical protein